MRVAGVRLDGGRAVWADARTNELSPLDRVTVHLEAEELSGWVFVAPAQLLQPPASIEGVIVEVLPRPEDDLECRELPGWEMPPLGTRVRTASAEGLVIAIDAAQSRVTLRLDDGVEVEVSPAQLR